MKSLIPCLLILLLGCSGNKINNTFERGSVSDDPQSVILGLDVLFDEKINLIKNKNIALVTNQSGVDKEGRSNYLKFLEHENVNLKVIFSPEHGLFGEAAAGEKLDYDKLNDMPQVISLYGNKKRPSKNDLKDIDIIVYDVQDVGARFYTYITTLGYVMEVASQAKIKIIVLDRPNPIKGNLIEGPLLNMDYQSFVGNYPIPIRYGLSIGELAKMMVGEKWIKGAPKLSVIKMKNWKRNQWYDETGLLGSSLPKYPDLNTALIYPGMCLLEATNINEGRGTDKPFKRFGAPWIDNAKLSNRLNELKMPGVEFKPVTYIPTDIDGMAINPTFKNKICKGIEIKIIDRDIYQSVQIGLNIISILRDEYPNKFVINDKRMISLLGVDELNIFNKMPIDLKSIFPNIDFIETSKKYILYN
ncbi:hypothetical protein CM15mP37_06850 [bacterium]|nr:MAG: hypothetical protein CM15mP37_06850 [bacterium]